MNFYVEVTTGPVMLTIDQIWPDGDAPQNPTKQDVRNVIEASGRSLWATAHDWALDLSAELFVN